jgi:CubicO group peptidase (beta-lactamase class C family)
MKKLFTLSIMTTLCVLYIFPAHPQAPNPEARHLLEILHQAQEKYGLKSIMFGAWIDGKEILVTTIGDSMTKVKAAEDMHFRIGGASFAYLTTLLLQLADQHIISLQDKLSKWFPDIPHADSVTLEMLARSTSGYADYVYTKSFYEKFYLDVFKEWTPQELISIGVNQPRTFNDPGKNWHFSHTNFVILAAVLEKITGKPLPVLLKENILDKLDLQNTACPLTPEIPAPALHTYTSERNVYEDSTYWNPSWVGHSARLTSNLSDMGKWLTALGTGKLISPQSFQIMIAPATVGLAANQPDLYFGLGVIIANSWIMYNPSFAGFTGISAYLPKKKIAIYINTTNADIKDRKSMHYSLAIFKDAAKYLAPDDEVPERFKA